MNRAHPLEQRGISRRVSRSWTLPPGVQAKLRHAKHARHGHNRQAGLVRAHEVDDPDGTAAVSLANQAAARDRMSRSSRNCVVSRRSRANASRSATDRASTVCSIAKRSHGVMSAKLTGRPSCLSACATQARITCAVGSNARDRSSGQASGSDQIDPLTATLRGISWACFGPLEASAGQPERLHQAGATSVWLAEAVLDATGDSVKLAFVDQGYTGERAADGAKAHGIEPEVVTRPEAKKGFVLLPRRWVVQRSCLDHPLPTPRPRLRALRRHPGRYAPHRVCLPHAETGRSTARRSITASKPCGKRLFHFPVC